MHNKNGMCEETETLIAEFGSERAMMDKTDKGHNETNATLTERMS